MQLNVNSKANELNCNDVFGNSLSWEMYKGKKILLSFLRFTGCPVCNLHVYELLEKKDDLDKKNISVIIVFESDTSTILKYIKNENLPFTFISDPNQVLYESYSVEKSWGKFIKWGLTLSGLSNGVKGFMKYNKFSSMKGTSNRVEAEFLIDESGILETVHYGSKVGDYIPISSYL
ncbi:MAG: redoxin domain-containing protein [Bacteroidota bacterium]